MWPTQAAPAAATRNDVVSCAPAQERCYQGFTDIVPSAPALDYRQVTNDIVACAPGLELKPHRTGELHGMPSVDEEMITEESHEIEGVNCVTINQNILNHGCNIGSVGGISMSASSDQGWFEHTERAVETAVAMTDAKHDSEMNLAMLRAQCFADQQNNHMAEQANSYMASMTAQASVEVQKAREAEQQERERERCMQSTRRVRISMRCSRTTFGCRQ